MNLCSSSLDPVHRRSRATLGALIAGALIAPAAGCGLDAARLVPDTVSQDDSLPALSLNGTRFRVETAGEPSDPVILMLHGGPGGDYEGLRAYLDLANDGYFVVLWDQRGSGLSQRHDCADVGVDTFLADIEAITGHFTATHDNPLFLVGHSWGAMYATMFIDEHPERVRSAVLSEPGGFTRGEIDEYLAEYLAPDFLDEGLNDILWRQQFLTADDHARADYQLLASALDAPDRVGLDRDRPIPNVRLGGVVARCLPTSVDEFDWTTNLHLFENRILFLHSELNQVADAEHQQRLASHYPNAELIMLADVGHDLMFQRSDEVMDLIRAHFASFQPQTAASTIDRGSRRDD